MYPIWKKEKVRSQAQDWVLVGSLKKTIPRYVLRCELYESRRNEDKQPRIHFVKYIGSISENDFDDALIINRFWQRVDNKLRSLKLSEQAEIKIREKIAARVPRPSEEAVNKAMALWKKKYYRLN